MCAGIRLTVVDVYLESTTRWDSENLNEITIYKPGLKKVVAGS